MMIWIVLTVMTAAAAVGLTLALTHKIDGGAEGQVSTVDVLKAQLADIAAQVRDGTLAPDDAAALESEIKRRIISETRDPLVTATNPLPKRLIVPVAVGLAVVLSLAATAIYAKLGQPGLAGGTGAMPAGDTNHPEGDVSAMIGKLEQQLRKSPADPKGWGMLAWSYFQTGRFADAATAYGRASALDPANAEFLSGQGESLVQAANNQVTPGAVAAFRQALVQDPADPRARYFLAMAKDQAGDHQGAMDDWIALLKSAPAGAPWAVEVRDFIQRAAKERGDNIEGRLPLLSDSPAPSDAISSVPGPTASQAEAANSMSPKDRQAMIEAMVERLAQRLKTNPNDPDGWVRLMRAHMVQGQPTKAQAAYKDAISGLAGSKAGQATVRSGAKDLGVPGV